jgi:uncharacterized protein YhdP
MHRLNIANPDGTMRATGEWKRAPAGRQREMQLDFAIEFVDAGKLLDRMGMPGMVSGGGGKLDGQIAWLGSPLSLDYSSLSGDLRLATTKGRFLKVDPGAARLLGVLSMQALPRVLSLDFSDVFSNGFAFDEIAGTASSSAGVLTTRDFRMIGPSASVMIEGSADLKQETQDLHVLVLPDVNAGSASLAYALLANPAIGLGTFVAQWILREPLSKAFAREYDVRGKWSDPQVGVHARPANAAVPTTP